MKIIVPILGAVAVVVVALVTAAVYVGGLTERVGNIEKWVAQDGERTKQEFEAFVVAPRRPGSEMGFNNPTTWGDWSEPVYCPQGYYVCGLKQRVEAPLGSKKDDTAMNAVAFYCCPLGPNASPTAR